jgi:signal transduction histidine kinase
LELITDLLHVQTSPGPLQGEQLDLEELLQYCVTLLQHKASEKQQQIVLHSMPATITGDREKLWRVFSNLIGNAIKFSAERGLITIRMESIENNILVSVQDNGIGIPAELQENVFDLSGKAKRKGTAGEASFGLGLVICKQIVELHNGKIWFATAQGSGTTFYVQLPANRS